MTSQESRGAASQTQKSFLKNQYHWIKSSCDNQEPMAMTETSLRLLPMLWYKSMMADKRGDSGLFTVA